MRFLQRVTKNIVRSEKQGIIMADKSAIEAIHKLSVENDKLRAENRDLLKYRHEKEANHLTPRRKFFGKAVGFYRNNPDGTKTLIDYRSRATFDK